MAVAALVASRIRARRGTRLLLLSARALVNVLIVSAATVVAMSAWILVNLDGRRYYTTPFAIRGYDQMHPILRPSGPIGQTLGVIGGLLMLVPFIYMLRKRLFRRAPGNLKTWLEIHIFCGIVGPVLVTFHTAFKFNGLVSVAYWSMVVVAISGFIGRYLYVRIPRTIRGVEVTEADLEDRAGEVREALRGSVRPDIMARLERFEQEVGARLEATPTLRGFATSGWRLRRQLRKVERDLERHGLHAAELHEVVDLVAERAQLLGRLRYLKKTKQLFELWHVFHLPLVYVMFVIVGLHVGVVLYLGYVPFRW